MDEIEDRRTTLLGEFGSPSLSPRDQIGHEVRWPSLFTKVWDYRKYDLEQKKAQIGLAANTLLEFIYTMDARIRVSHEAYVGAKALYDTRLARLRERLLRGTLRTDLLANEKVHLESDKMNEHNAHATLSTQTTTRTKLLARMHRCNTALLHLNDAEMYDSLNIVLRGIDEGANLGVVIDRILGKVQEFDLLTDEYSNLANATAKLDDEMARSSEPVRDEVAALVDADVQMLMEQSLPKAPQDAPRVLGRRLQEDA